MHRTTIEIDDELIEEAKQTLGTTTIRATVEEALRRNGPSRQRADDR